MAAWWWRSIGCGLAVALAASPAWAGGKSAGFRSPSGNIHCLYDPGWEGPPAYGPYVRCDIRDIDGALPPAPSSCEGEWGRSFSIGAEEAIGQMLCAGDTVFNEENPPLAYGTVWQEGNFSCASDEKGLTCFNTKNHGFMLSKKDRRVF